MPYSKRSVYCHERIVDPKKFDKRSFRVVQSGFHKITIGCPKGHYDSKRKICKIGTRIQKILHPEGEGKCPVGGKALKHNPAIKAQLAFFYDQGIGVATNLIHSGITKTSDAERYIYNAKEDLEDMIGGGLHQIENDLFMEGIRHGLEGI